MGGFIAARGIGGRAPKAGAVRAIFVLYLVLIASGIAFYMAIGLTHN
jgi:hypothetical protein